MIIAVEGIDGAGKNTLVTAVKEAVGASSIAFPRYEESLPAQLAHEALHGRMGDMTDSAYAMATLFALDRAGVRERLESFVDTSEIILLDRYVASNAAYSWARTQDESIVDWISDLEFSRLGLPEPDLQILLATEPELAARRAERREASDSTRTRDAYERDGGLQQRTYDAYVALSQRSWHSPWLITTNPADVLEAITRYR